MIKLSTVLEPQQIIIKLLRKNIIKKDSCGNNDAGLKRNSVTQELPRRDEEEKVMKELGPFPFDSSMTL